jgi:hypothetical protein
MEISLATMKISMGLPQKKKKNKLKIELLYNLLVEMSISLTTMEISMGLPQKT